MDPIDRIGWLLLGCAIGFVLGWIVRGLRDIKEELDELDKHVHFRDPNNNPDETGAMKLPKGKDIALMLVVALTFYAALMSQIASNKSSDTADKMLDTQQAIINLQSEQKQNLDCTTQVLFDAIRALNERTEYTSKQAQANVALVKAQLDLLLRGQDPNLTDAESQALLNVYISKVQEFIELSAQTASQQVEFPYPTVQDLSKCLAGEPNDSDPDPSDGSTSTPSSDASSTDKPTELPSEAEVSPSE